MAKFAYIREPKHVLSSNAYTLFVQREFDHAHTKTERAHAKEALTNMQKAHDMPHLISTDDSPKAGG